MVRLGARSCCRLARMCAHWDARPSSMRTTCVCGRYTTCGGYDYFQSRRATKMKREVAEWLRGNSVYANVTKPHVDACGATLRTAQWANASFNRNMLVH